MSHDRSDRDAADGSDGLREEEWLVVEFAVPTDEFLLGSTLEAAPETVVEFEQFVPTSADPLPYLWTTDDDREAFEGAAASDPTVERIRRIAAFDQGALYELDWADLTGGLFEWLRSTDVTVLQSESLDDEWLLKLRLPTRDAFGDLREYCRDERIPFRLVRLFTMTEPKMGQFNVSEKQREILIVALEMGYFEIPREATLTEVADALGISSNSASERLRRAQTNLVSNTVTIGSPTGVGIGIDAG